MKKQIHFLSCFIFLCITAAAQQSPLVNTSSSMHALLRSPDMRDAQWTRGFWAERFAVSRDSMIPHLW